MQINVTHRAATSACVWVEMEGAGKVIARVLLRQEYKADMQVKTLAGTHINVHIRLHEDAHVLFPSYTSNLSNLITKSFFFLSHSHMMVVSGP